MWVCRKYSPAAKAQRGSTAIKKAPPCRVPAKFCARECRPGADLFVPPWLQPLYGPAYRVAKRIKRPYQSCWPKTTRRYHVHGRTDQTITHAPRRSKSAAFSTDLPVLKGFIEDVGQARAGRAPPDQALPAGALPERQLLPAQAQLSFAQPPAQGRLRRPLPNGQAPSPAIPQSAATHPARHPVNRAAHAAPLPVAPPLAL